LFHFYDSRISATSLPSPDNAISYVLWSYITSLPKAEQETPAWWTAAELLMLVAEHGGDLMMARIVVMRALHRHKPEAAPAPRRKQARA
jgi:hypothetical protein